MHIYYAQERNNMSFWKKVKRSAIADRLVEEKLYEQALHEFELGVRRDGLWAKAFRKSNGDEQKANALYLEYRVQSIKDDAEIAGALLEHFEEERAKTHAKLSPPVSNKENGKLDTNKSDHPENKKKKFSQYKGPLPQHKGPEVQCETCGFIAFGTPPELAISKRCLNCGSINIKCNKPDTQTDYKTRVLCSDGACIGVIGADGKCKDCGRQKGLAVTEAPKHKIVKKSSKQRSGFFYFVTGIFVFVLGIFWLPIVVTILFSLLNN